MTEPRIDVRDCVEADVPHLARHDPRPAAKLPQQHFEDAQSSDQRFLVAFVDESPAGWGVLDCTDEELTPQLSHLWVFPGARRHGVGRRISTFIERQAKDLGHQEIFLMVDPDNGKAVPLWLDLGYKPTGEHRMGPVDETGEQTHQAIYRKSLKN